MSQNISSPKQKTFFNKIASLFVSFGVLGIFGLVILLGIVSGIFFAYIDTAGELSLQQLKIKDSTSVLYDIAGKPVESIYGAENREWVDIDRIPLRLRQAFISIEDERFYQHNGIDLKRIAGAALSYIKTGGHAQYGASTITQQLIKNLTGDKQSSIKRKIQEQWRAVQLEKVLSKEQILELYLNIVPLGNGTNGVQSASKYYFGKDVSELSTAECASLAGITKYPVYFDPFNHPDNNKKREDDILYKMNQLKFITNDQYNEAINQKMDFKRATVEHVSNHSYFADQVINDVVGDLQDQKGYSKVIAEKLVYGGGLKIYTTMDSNIQKSMNDVYTNSKNFVKTNTSSQPESSMVILDPKNGQVRGLIGGVGEKKGKRTLNRATQSFRQPGSTIKPLSVYAPAIEEGKITPNTIISDSPIQLGDWSPHNYDNSYRGNITIKEAVAHSINVVAVKVLEKVGLDDSYAFLKRLGISTLQSQDKNYASLALGGLTKGVSPLEMAAAYATFDNNGIYIKPYTYLKVVDSEGKVILENTSTESRAVMTEDTAKTMTELLQNVVTSGTGTVARLSKMPAAGKTGTASDMKDKWFLGYTPYYVGAVWYGFDQPQDLPPSTWNMSLTLWKDVMEQVHANLPYKDFTTSKSSKIQVAICTLSGKRATDLCYKDINGSTVKLVTYTKGTEPTDYCDIHKPVKICTGSNQLATKYCPPNEVEERSIAVIPGQPAPQLENCTMHGPGAKNSSETKSTNNSSSPSDNNATNNTTKNNSSNNNNVDINIPTIN